MITILNPLTKNVDFALYEDTLNKILECHFFTADEDLLEKYRSMTIKYRDMEFPDYRIQNEDIDILKDEVSEFGPEVKLYVEPEPVVKVD